jgi:hypothetical protein
MKSCVLRASYDCALRFEDFLATFDDEETAVQSIMPLQVVELKPGDRLLVVTCDYQLADRTGYNDAQLAEAFAYLGRGLA